METKLLGAPKTNFLQAEFLKYCWTTPQKHVTFLPNFLHVYNAEYETTSKLDNV